MPACRPFLQIRPRHGKRVFTRLVYVGVLFVGNCSTVKCADVCAFFFRKKRQIWIIWMINQFKKQLGISQLRTGRKIRFPTVLHQIDIQPKAAVPGTTSTSDKTHHRALKKKTCIEKTTEKKKTANGSCFKKRAPYSPLPSGMFSNLKVGLLPAFVNNNGESKALGGYLNKTTKRFQPLKTSPRI